LRSSVYASVLGRQLGLPAKDLYSLAIGGLLFDIGKLRLDDSILNADRRLTAEEMTKMQRHVETGLSLLKRSGLTDPDIIDIIANHHERLDGSGYPQGLGGNFIPAFGRIAGVVDCYNAITGSRRYASTRSPAEAINQLYKLKGVHFHKDLIEEFIHAIGVYPVGALVELSTGEVAIVVAQSRARRLRPVVLILLDGNKNHTAGGRYIFLEETTHSDDGSKLDIVKNLEPDAFGIDRATIKLSF
jgi:HD-GYP domain-containing protein (c-di-GMP phosphodiesterase class II)